VLHLRDVGLILLTFLIPVEDRRMIMSSWDRCYSLGLEPTDSIQEDLLSTQQIHELCQENDQLIYHAAPILERLTPWLKSSGQVALLVERGGVILRSL
jgi:sigma-54 dependent transcriptional regulator, acetoin dehydrogenase operon transcriptional activator AcoR